MIDEANMELIRVHKQMRKAKYEPKDGHTPIPWEFLDTKRKTIMEFHKGKTDVKEDDRRSGDPPSLLSLGKVGLSLGYLLEVSRVKPRYRLRLRRVILPEARRDHQRILSAKGSLKTAQGEQEPPEALHTERHRSEGEFAPREAFNRERNPRYQLLL